MAWPNLIVLFSADAWRQLRRFWLRYEQKDQRSRHFQAAICKNEEYNKWRADWLNEITKGRVVDKDFREQIKSDRVLTCEKLFKPEEVEICEYQIRFCNQIILTIIK